MYFAICNLVVGWLPSVLQVSFVAQDVLDGATVHHRLLAWAVFADAIWLKPWFGYGWNQSAVAQMAAAALNPSVNSVFSFAHNLFLDLVIWCGIPLGLFISVCLLRWFWLRFKAVQTAENAVLVLFLLVVS